MLDELKKREEERRRFSKETEMGEWGDGDDPYTGEDDRMDRIWRGDGPVDIYEVISNADGQRHGHGQGQGRG